MTRIDMTITEEHRTRAEQLLTLYARQPHTRPHVLSMHKRESLSALFRYLVDRALAEVIIDDLTAKQDAVIGVLSRAKWERKSFHIGVMTLTDTVECDQQTADELTAYGILEFDGEAYSVTDFGRVLLQVYRER